MIYYDIKYVIIGGLRFYEWKEIKDVLVYLWVIFNLVDIVSLFRIFNILRRGIGKIIIEILLNVSF